MEVGLQGAFCCRKSCLATQLTWHTLAHPFLVVTYQYNSNRSFAEHPFAKVDKRLRSLAANLIKLRLPLQLLVKVCNKGASTLTLLDTHVSRRSLPRAACTSPNYMANSCQIDAWVSNPQWENDFECLHHILQGILQKESLAKACKSGHVRHNLWSLVLHVFLFLPP